MHLCVHLEELYRLPHFSSGQTTLIIDCVAINGIYLCACITYYNRMFFLGRVIGGMGIGYIMDGLYILKQC